MRYVKPITLFHDLMKANAPDRGRLLGIDVGCKYVGLAVSDVHNTIASPLSVLIRKKTNISSMAKDFETLISEFSLEGIIIGSSFRRQRYTLDTLQVRLLVQDLQKTGILEVIKYTYWDENFTSKCVESLLKPLNLGNITAKNIVDKCSAVGILQVYLDHVNGIPELKNLV
ncbi:hypothetical protein GIB67_035338 [Kingdonia uniflora]|uniref:YqgF/RNase H-like domain-containing protein n=1 Tax=Kingdonia uniflora TaxID=39325 RepID=A0A7J7LY55_9MAGN|nr:hypothetical protein GIB67_035338 [Kingdonia uniflora]